MTMTAALRPGRGVVGQVARFGVVGAGGAGVNLLLFAVLHPALGGQVANAVAAVLATVVGTAANRRFTFGSAETGPASRTQLQGLLVTVASTVTAGLLLRVVSASGSGAELAVVAGVNAVFGVLRFALLRRASGTREV